jgi:[protein-PII] uridylyltransferase
MKRPILKKTDLPPIPTECGGSAMTTFAGEVRDVYREFLGELEKGHRAGMPGFETARSCSAGVGTIVEHLFDSVRIMMGRKARKVPALVALGGFGRKELSPRSDVDLLCLWGKRGGREGSAFAGFLVRMMWDSGLSLGHSVRTMPELRRALRRDLDLKTALLDGRWICGDEDLKEQLAQLKAEIRDREGGSLLEAKLEEARRRWRKFGGSYHLIEPNIKESPGGMRDFQTLRWVGMVLPWEGTLEGLYRLAIIDRGDIKELQRAFDFLLRTRHELHFLSQSDWNVLTVEMQRAVAVGLGYSDKGHLLAVERFMRDYYSNAMVVYKALELILEETRGKGNLRIIDGSLYRRVGTKGLGRLDVRLVKSKMKDDPLFVFKEQLETGRKLSPHLEKRIKNAFRAEKLPETVLRKMRRSFIEILEMPGRKADVIRSMHELGVLRHIFPPFERLTCLKRYDLYHQYTADEHSLQAISHLEELADRESGLLSRIYGEVAEKTELLLATILHDIGKVSAKGHARSGAQMSEMLLKRFPMSAKSRSLVSFLIRNHLLLSHFSQRRDMEDLDTGLQFIKRIKNHVNLKLLYLLTYTDLRATGSGVWTGWKENLLEDLYFKASRMLAEKSESTAAYGRVIESRRKRIIAACSGAAERKKMEEHLDSLPARYITVVSPSQAMVHLQMIGELGGKLAVSRLRRLRHSLELVVCTRDRPYRLSQLCGVITINDLNILGAYAFTRSDGIVIDLFHLERVEGGLGMTAEGRRLLAKSLDDVLANRVDLEGEYESHVKRWRRRYTAGIPVSCMVEFENDLSRESTIIDLTAADRPGLLYRVTKAFSSEGLDIQSAQITTRGGVAEDSFYVRTADGKKLSDASRMRSIRRKLVSELE